MERTCTDTFCAVDKNEGNDGHVPLGFDLVVVFLQVVQQRVVPWVEYRARDRSRLGEDVTSRGVVFPALVARPVLAVRQQEVQVIASDVILRKVDDGHRQTLLAVVICRMLGDVPDELRDLWDRKKTR